MGERKSTRRHPPLDKARARGLFRELASGTRPAVFVDDSGSPGAALGLDPDRKTWVAVVVTGPQMSEIIREMPRALHELRLQLGASELHFADIYSGRGPYKGKPLEQRLGLFRLIAHMFDVHKFPVFVQTLTPGQVLEVHHIAPIPSLLPHFDLTKPADCALIVLLLRVKAHLEGQSPVVPACLFVDEGLRKDGRAIRIPSWSSAFAEGMICFSRSDVAFPLQLADFAAYSLNRSQILLAKQHLSDLDLEFLRIVQPLAVCFQNIPVGFADLQSVRNRQGN